MTSTAYAELGGGTPPPTTPGHRHRYDRTSGWCGCGRRDDGRLAEGSPAWREQLRSRRG